MTDWVKIKAEYLKGNTTLKELSDKYGVSFSHIQKVSANEKWTDLKKKKGRIAEEKIVEAIASKEVRKVDKLQDCADLLLDRISQGLRDGTLGVMSGRGLRDISGALKDIREIKGIKSEADMREQEARINKLIKDTQEEKKDSTIVVEFKGGIDDYAD